MTGAEMLASSRSLCFLLAVAIGGELASYRAIAPVVARAFLGISEDTEYSLLPYVLFFVFPASVIFWIAGSVGIVRSAQSRRMWTGRVLAIIAVADVVLLVLSVLIYYRLVLGVGD